ncbi:MAG: Gfo/Idh/MocA family oxidoreductase [Planctomycetota bacterium]
MSPAEPPLRFGVVGYGFGQFHVRTLAAMPDVNLAAVADRRSDSLPAAAAEYGFTPYRDALEMIAKENLDAVVIAIPPKPRRELLTAAVEQNLALFVEKPWASHAAHARELADICRRSAAPVMAGFSFRYHPALVKLKSLLAGDLGPPRMLQGQYVFGWLPPRDGWAWDPTNGNGFINENSCHLFDAVCHLMGRPTRVSAEGGRFTGKPMEDAVTVTLRFQNDTIAALTCGGIGHDAFTDYPRIELFAEHGQAQLTGEQHAWRSLKWATHQHPTPQHLDAPPTLDQQTAYTPALEHFVRCIREGATPSATLRDAILSVDLAMAVAESARSGQPVALEAVDPAAG